MNEYTIQVSVTVKAESELDARYAVSMFMPWANGATKWNIEGHDYPMLGSAFVQRWEVEGLDPDDFVEYLIDQGIKEEE